VTAWLLLNLPTWLIAVLVIGIPTLAAMAAMAQVRRRVPVAMLIAHNVPGVDIWARASTVYAIFVAFVVVVAWEQLGHARQALATEAATLAALYRECDALAEPYRQRVQGQIRAYVRSVIDDEWQTMSGGQRSLHAQEQLDALWSSLLEFEPSTQREGTAYGEAYARLPELTRQRELRILASGASIPGVFWLVLIGGGALEVGFALLLGMTSVRVQTAMVGMLTAMISSALFLIIVLDRPFTGDIRAEPTAFEDALRLMDPPASR
jgi:Protein of unknown function (DUF4239)